MTMNDQTQPEVTAELRELVQAGLAGRLSRRQIVRRALALGLSGGAISALLAACGSASTQATATSVAQTAAAVANNPGAAATASNLATQAATVAATVAPGASGAVGSAVSAVSSAVAASPSATTGGSPVALALPKVTPEKAKLTFAVGGQEQFIYLPLTLAKQLNYFKDQGLDVQIANFSGGSKAAEALVGGSADFVMGFYDHTIQTQPKGENLQAVCLIDATPGIVMLVSNKAVGKIAGLTALKGATIGITAAGSSTEFFANYILASQGLSPDAVSKVAIGTGSTAYAAISEGKVDVGMTVDPVATQLVKDGKATVLWDTRNPQQAVQALGGPYPAGSFYSKSDFIQKNPQTVQALVNAGVQALQFIQTHSAAEIADKMPQEFYTNDKSLYVQSLQNSLSLFSPNGLMPQDGPPTVQKVLATSDESIKNAKIDLSATYTNKFVQAALGK